MQWMYITIYVMRSIVSKTKQCEKKCGKTVHHKRSRSRDFSQTYSMSARRCMQNDNRHTHIEPRIPGTGAERCTIGAEAETAHAVVVACENADMCTREGVPGVACRVIVAAEKDVARDRESDACYAAGDALMRERVHLTISADIKEAARCVG
jgi:hypothetical protein